MNNIIKSPLARLGYDFIKTPYLPTGESEYYLRFRQNTRSIYRGLTAEEISQLKQNGNTSDDWSKVLAGEKLDTSLIQNCTFYGLIRLGNLEPFVLSFSELQQPVGLYNSTIVSSDFGDNVSIHDCNYISHYIIGSEVIILNVNELLTTSHAKFGNGIVKEGEPESVRIWLELCNENAGRRVLPFDGMLPGDAWLWSKYRDNEKLMERFRKFTEKEFSNKRGYYGKIGDRTVIKNCKIIKDTCIGSDAYLKGANKIKNITINSSPTAKSQVGEGCEIVNGIVGYGCRIFYGVKAVRFIMADMSQLKYGARLINSYLGSNATISCCEVLNSLIFPAHEQHHNNSFLCAALVMGQSNIAAGATIGSNHNSRSPDGELIAGRGFWPGLCVSLKHNSRFASYTILAKGDYPAEMDIPLPFSLVSNDVANNRLVVMPAYWFMYNMYALARNSWKYVDRDKRVKKIQHIEYDYLAPDIVNEIFTAIELLEKWTGRALAKKENLPLNEEQITALGREALQSKDSLPDVEVVADGLENSKRKTIIAKPQQAYHIFRELIFFYAISYVANWLEANEHASSEEVFDKIPELKQRKQWVNIGGQLLPKETALQLIQNIESGEIDSWENIHRFYQEKGSQYPTEKIYHALASLQEITGSSLQKITAETWNNLLQQTIATKEWMVQHIADSRAKDYENPFRQMVYDTQVEMDKVIGKLADNSFIQQEEEGLIAFRKKMERMRAILVKEIQPV